MTHYTLFHLPHDALNPPLSSRSPHRDAEDTLPPGPTAGLAICAVIPDASPAHEHPDSPSHSVYDSASEDTTPPYTREYVADLRRQLGEAERQLGERRGDAERVRNEQAEEQREAQAGLVRSRIEAQRAREEQERVQEEQADRISELTWEVSIRDARIRELQETNARLEIFCATLAASRDRLSDALDELSAIRTDLEDIVEERQRRVEERQHRVEELERQGRALEASNAERQEQIQALEASIAELETDHAALKENMKKAVKRYKELTEAQAALEERVAALTASNEERGAQSDLLVGQIGDLEGQIASLATQFAPLEKECEAKEEIIAKLRHELASAEGAMEAAESTNANLTKENADLAEENRKLKSTVDSLEAEHAAASAELDSLRLEKMHAEASLGALEFALVNKESRSVQLDATVTSLSGQLEATKAEKVEATANAEASNEKVAALSAEREALIARLTDAHMQIDALREPPLASDDDIAGVLSEVDQAMRRIAEDIASNVVPISDVEFAEGRVVASGTTQLPRARLGATLYDALTRDDADSRRAVLPHALRAILAHWVRGAVGRWSLTDDEENVALRRVYERIVQNYDPQAAGKWRALALRVSSRADNTLCTALESSLLENLAAVLSTAHFDRGPREDAETLDALVESLVWKVVELREHIGVVVTDRELALVLPRPGDRFNEATMQVTPAASVAPPQEAEGDGEKGRAGGNDVVDESNEGDLVAEVSCGVALGLVRYQGTAPFTVVKSRVLQR